MNKLVAHAGHLAPGNFRRLLAERLRYALCRLANYLQIPDDRILDYRCGEELVPARLGVAQSPVDCVADMQEIDPLVFQSCTASARMRSRR